MHAQIHRAHTGASMSTQTDMHTGNTGTHTCEHTCIHLAVTGQVVWWQRPDLVTLYYLYASFVVYFEWLFQLMCVVVQGRVLR